MIHSIQTHSIKAPTKVNLTLYITHVTQSGFHHLQSIVGFYDLFDLIYIKESSKPKFSYDSFVKVDDDFKSNNGLMKAYSWLSSKFKLPNLEIHVEKHIPIKAGLGGGSSDIAAFIYKLCELYEIDKLIIKNSISELGADVLVCFLYHIEKHSLFFINGTGKEGVSIIKEIPNYLLNPTILITPKIHLSTKQVFENFYNFKHHPPKDTCDDIKKAILFGENVLIKNALKIAHDLNDFSLNNLLKIDKRIKMSGTGSACFLIEECDFKQEFLKSSILKSSMWCKNVRLC